MSNVKKSTANKASKLEKVISTSKNGLKREVVVIEEVRNSRGKVISRSSKTQHQHRMGTNWFHTPPKTKKGSNK